MENNSATQFLTSHLYPKMLVIFLCRCVFVTDVGTEQPINVFNLPIESFNICLSETFGFVSLWCIKTVRNCFSCHIDVFSYTTKFGFLLILSSNLQKLPKMWRCYVCLALLYSWAVSYMFKCSIASHFLLKKRNWTWIRVRMRAGVHVRVCPKTHNRDAADTVH